MAYTETKAGSGVDKTFDNSFITRNELYAILDQLKEESKFYELEVFEVVEINTTSIGEVIGRYVFSEQGSSVEEVQDRTFLPLNSNIIQYPLRGELWLGMSYRGQQYYLARLSENITDVNFQKFNESTISENQTTNFSRGGDFIDIKPIPATIDEGDTLIQGRFGNYIKLSSRQNEGPDDSSRITINNKKSVIDLESVEDSALIGMSSDSIIISARKNVDIVAEGDVFINGNSVTVKNNEAVNIVTQQLVTDYVGGITKDLNIELNNDTRLLPKNSIEWAKQMEPFVTYLQGEIQALVYLILPPTLPSGLINPLFAKGWDIKLETLKKLAKKIKEFFNLEFLPLHDFETVSLNDFFTALGLDGLSIDFPIDEWETFYNDIDALKQKVLDAQTKAQVALQSVQALNAAFDVIQGGGGSVETIVEALDAYEADPNNPPLDTIDIRDVISDGADVGDIANYLNFGGSPQVRDAIQGAVQAEQDSQQLNQIVRIVELTKPM